MSAATELKVLIQVIQDGGGLKALLSDTTRLSEALKNLPQGGKSAEGIENIRKKGQQLGEEEGPKKHADHLKGLEHAAERAAQGMESLIRGVKFLAGGFLALESVRFIKELADTAARTEVLGTVLHVVGNNAGYANDYLDRLDRSVQQLGITAEDSRKSLTQLIQAGLDPGLAGGKSGLARAAQDLAVIGGINSSEAFSRMVVAIQRRNTMMLRTLGIMVMTEEAERRYAAVLHKSVGELSTLDKQVAFANETLRKAADLTGTYEAALTNVGKMLTSLPRLFENLRDAAGERMLTAYTHVIVKLTEFLQIVTVIIQSQDAFGDSTDGLSSIVTGLTDKFFTIARVLVENADIVWNLIKVYFYFRAAMMAVHFATMLWAGLAGLGGIAAKIIMILPRMILWTASIVSQTVALVTNALGWAAVGAAQGTTTAGMGPALFGTASLTTAMQALSVALGGVSLGWVAVGLAITGVGVILVAAIAAYKLYQAVFAKKPEIPTPPLTAAQIAASPISGMAEKVENAGNDAYRGMVLGEQFEEFKRQNPAEVAALRADPNSRRHTQIGMRGVVDEQITGSLGDRFKAAIELARQARTELTVKSTAYQELKALRAKSAQLDQDVRDEAAKIPVGLQGDQMGQSGYALAVQARRDNNIEIQARQKILSGDAGAKQQIYEDYKAAIVKDSELEHELIEAQESSDAHVRGEIEHLRAAKKASSSAKKEAQGDWDFVRKTERKTAEELAAEDLEVQRQAQRVVIEQRRTRLDEELKANIPESTFTTTEGAAGRTTDKSATLAGLLNTYTSMLDDVSTPVLSRAEELLPEDERLKRMEELTVQKERDRVSYLEKAKVILNLMRDSTQTPLDQENNQRAADAFFRRWQTDTTGLPVLTNFDKARLNIARRTMGELVRKQKEQANPVFDALNERELAATQKVQQGAGKARLDAIKIEGDREDAVLQDLYNRRLISLDEYLKQKLGLIQTEGEAELVFQRLAVTHAEADLKLEQRLHGAAADPSKIQELTEAITVAQRKLTEMEGFKDEVPVGPTFEREGTAVGKPQTAERTKFITTYETTRGKIRDMNLESAQAQGGLAEKIAVLTQKAREEEKALLGVAGAHEAVARALAIKIEDAKSAERLRLLTEYVQVEEALVGLEKQRLQLAVQQGTLTPREAMRRGNRLVDLQIATKEEQISRTKAEIDIQQAAIDKRRMEIAEEDQQHNEIAGSDAELRTTEDTLARMESGTQAMTNGVTKLKLEVQGFQGELLTFAAEYQRYGDQLASTFRDSLGAAISSTLQDARKGAEAFRNFGKQVLGNITDVIGGHVASKVTTSIINRTSKKEEMPGPWAPGMAPLKLGKDGKPINVPGTSAFEKVFDLMGLGDKDRNKMDGSLAKPFKVEIVKDLTGDVNTSTTAIGPDGQPMPVGELIHQNFETQLKESLPSFSVGGFNINVGAIMDIMKMFQGIKMPGSTVGLRGSGFGSGGGVGYSAGPFAEGGLISGPGTGTSDSIDAKVSAGEHIMPAAITKQFLPLLEGLRKGTITKAHFTQKFMLGGLVGPVHSVALAPIIPRHYAGGGVVVSDAGAAAVTPGTAGPSNMQVTLHPETMNMTMRDWLEHETVRQYGRR